SRESWKECSSLMQVGGCRLWLKQALETTGERWRELNDQFHNVQCPMSDEFYHKDLFGAVVDFSPEEDTEEEKRLLLQGRPDFNIFTITDAVGARDKRRAWVLYMQALAAGFSAEEVFFKIVWQVKSMLIARKTASVVETDMKP